MIGPPTKSETLLYTMAGKVPKFGVPLTGETRWVFGRNTAGADVVSGVDSTEFPMAGGAASAVMGLLTIWR